MPPPMSAASEPVLRPLSLGEIFDSAVTLFVRHVGPFTYLFAILALPLLIAEIALGNGWNSIQQYVNEVLHPERAHIVSAPWSVTVYWVAIALQILFSPLASAAAGLCVGSIYETGEASWRQSLRRAFRRLPAVWIALLAGAVFMFAVAMFGAFVLFLLGYVLTLGLAAAAGQVASAIVGVILGLAAMLGMLLLMLVLYMAVYVIAIEDGNPLRALGASCTRLFNRSEFRRVVLMAAAIVAAYLGNMAVGLGVAALSLGVVHSQIPAALVNTCIGIVFSGFISVLFGVYYFDVRLRHEGFDLQNEIDRVTSSQSA